MCGSFFVRGPSCRSPIDDPEQGVVKLPCPPEQRLQNEVSKDDESLWEVTLSPALLS